MTSDHLERGRAAFLRQTWSEAYAELSAANDQAPLQAEDLLQLALACSLTGRDDECVTVLTRAHEQFLSRADLPKAAQCAIWLGMTLFNALERVRAGAWIARAERLLDESGVDCVERGWLLIPRGRQLSESGDPAAAQPLFEQARDIALRFGDRDLLALSGMGVGVCRVYSGRVQDGLASLDELMTAIEARELTPNVAGILYCALIDVCHDVFDIRRAQEWTGAMTAWCEAQPELVPFHGVCQVHRAQILQLHGDWPDAHAIAEEVASQAPDRAGARAVGPAHYRLAELYRLRGDYSRAEAAYRSASRHGCPPEPGLAQMRMVQGQAEAAAAMIGRALDEAQDRASRSRLLPAYVEIMLEAANLEAARAGAAELRSIAQELEVPYLHACAACAEGAVLLACGHPREALGVLREAYVAWQTLQAPYESARTRELLGLVCRALGDADRAALELDGAAWTYRQLGAAADLARLTRPAADRAAAPDGLTDREVEVLRLIAAGMSNRAIASELVLSEKTVARHVSNIFIKLKVASRAAATAYAYEHQLVSPT